MKIFTLLLMIWIKCIYNFYVKDNSTKASANRGKMKFDHFLEPKSFVQIEHRYKKKTVNNIYYRYYIIVIWLFYKVELIIIFNQSQGHQVMPVNLLVLEGYTTKAGYDKTEKVERIKKMQVFSYTNSVCFLFSIPIYY